jgi:hypothetical protein
MYYYYLRHGIYLSMFPLYLYFHHEIYKKGTLKIKKNKSYPTKFVNLFCFTLFLDFVHNHIEYFMRHRSKIGRGK